MSRDDYFVDRLSRSALGLGGEGAARVAAAIIAGLDDPSGVVWQLPPAAAVALRRALQGDELLGPDGAAGGEG